MNIKPIPGFDGYYASECGKIFSEKKTIPMIEIALTKTQNGYLRTKIGRGKVARTIAVHRAVAMAWCEGYLPKLPVNHKDCNKLNNHYTNLEWVTHKQNMAHSVKCGLRTGKKHGNGFGRKVWRESESGEKSFSSSLRQASRDIGIDPARGVPNIHAAINGKQPRAYKYKWGYV